MRLVRVRSSRRRHASSGAAVVILLLPHQALFAQTPAGPNTASYVTDRPTPGGFVLAVPGASTPVYVSNQDYPGVRRAVEDLRSDIGRVSGTSPRAWLDSVPRVREVVIVGALGHSPVIDKLVRDGRLDVRGVAGRWEAYLVETVKRPL